jgi:hypothetical protein
MENPFGSASNKPQEQSEGYAELPLEVWFLARTSDKGGAAPYIKDTREGVPFIFKTGLYCVGGDGTQVTRRNFGGYTFFQAFIRPNYSEQGGPQTQEEWDTLSGRLTGFINAVLSPGIEDKAERWSHSFQLLTGYATELANSNDPDLRTTGEMFDVDGGMRDNASYMATVFALLLKSSPRQVIVNQKVDKGAKGDRNDIVVGSFKDAIAANAKTKAGAAIEPFPSKDGETFDLYTVRAEGEGTPSDF